MVKREEGRAVEQQVVPGDVNEGMGEASPPFTVLNRAGLEHHRAPAGASQDGDVEQGEQSKEEQQFRPTAQRTADRSYRREFLTSAHRARHEAWSRG